MQIARSVGNRPEASSFGSSSTVDSVVTTGTTGSAGTAQSGGSADTAGTAKSARVVAAVERARERANAGAAQLRTAETQLVAEEAALLGLEALLPAAVHKLLLELRKSRNSGVERWVSRVQADIDTLTAGLPEAQITAACDWEAQAKAVDELRRARMLALARKQRFDDALADLVASPEVVASPEA
jgi:hypothetical protein